MIRAQPSVVPSLSTAPIDPLRLRLLLIVSSYGVGVFAALFMLVATRSVLALPGLDGNGVLRLAAAQVVVNAAALVGVTHYGVAGMLPLHHALLEGPRLAPRTHPSERAVRMAFSFPELGCVFNTVLTQLVALLDLTGLVPISGLTGWPRISVNLLSFALAAASLYPTIILWKSLVWLWLGRLHPDDVKLATHAQLGRRFSLTVALPVAAVGLVALVVLGSHLVAAHHRLLGVRSDLLADLDIVATAFAALIIVVTTALAWRAARAHGKSLAADLGTLTQQLTRFEDPSAVLPSPGDFDAFAGTSLGKNVARALDALNARFAELRAHERQGLRAMEEVQQIKNQFLASMSHDLRSPLNSILGFTHLIESGGEGPLTEAQRESLQMISRSSRDLLRLVTNILDSARLEAGRLALRRSWTPSVEILTQAVTEGRRMIGDRPLEIEAELEPGLPPVYADADRVVQAVVGLFSHAIDAMERGRIRLVARIGSGPPGPEQHLRVDVVDRGAGIREADKATLFQAFREVQEPSGKRIGGLGLGLSVARELVRAHGGDIWFMTAAGKGTTFTVAIPLGGPPITPPTARSRR